MTNRELDAWIAAHVMGWRNCQPDTQSYKWEFGDVEPYVMGIGLSPEPCYGRCFSRQPLPFYTTDLNACALAEAKIAEMGYADGWPVYSHYGDALMDFAEAKFPEGDLAEIAPRSGAFYLATLTARQRCDAMYAIREHIRRTRCKEGEPDPNGCPLHYPKDRNL